MQRLGSKPRGEMKRKKRHLMEGIQKLDRKADLGNLEEREWNNGYSWKHN